MHELRFVSVVVVLGSSPYVYFGMVDADGVVFDDSGVPDRFVLKGAYRTKIGDNEATEAHDSPYPIKGEYLIVRLSEIKTINLTWIGVAH